MTRAQKLLQAMNDIDDTFLLEAEEPFAQAHKRKSPMKWFVTVLAILGLSASAYAAIQWHPFFQNYFNPTAELIAKTEGIAQNVQAIAEYDDLTLRIEQTIGDEHSLYVKLDVILPDGKTWRDIIPKEAIQGKDETCFSITPEYQFFSGSIPYEKIKSLTIDEINKIWWEQDYLYESSGLTSSDFDLDSDSATYLIYFHTTEENLTDDNITLLIPYFKATHDIGYEGVWSITWKPENHGTQYEFTLKNSDDSPVGMVYVSSFYFDVNYNYRNINLPKQMQRDYKKLSDFHEEISFNFKDGTQKSLRSLSFNSGGTFGESWVSCKSFFNPILDLDTVESIQVGPYLCELN